MSTNYGRRVKGLVAGACGAALLLAGGTWALWYDSAHVAGAKILAGNLDIARAGDEAIYDISDWVGDNRVVTKDGARVRESADATGKSARGDSAPLALTAPCVAGSKYASAVEDPAKSVYGHLAALTGVGDELIWNAVPGDKVLAIWNYAVALDGDNLVADLKIEPDIGSKGVKAEATKDFLVDKELEVWVDGKEIKIPDTDFSWDTFFKGGDPAILTRLQAENEAVGQDDPGIQVVKLKSIPDGTLTTANANVCIVLKGGFDATVGTENFSGLPVKGQELTRAKLLEFVDFNVTLEQTRKDVVGNF